MIVLSYKRFRHMCELFIIFNYSVSLFLISNIVIVLVSGTVVLNIFINYLLGKDISCSEQD
jgi:hypothetical protein